MGLAASHTEVVSPRRVRGSSVSVNGRQRLPTVFVQVSAVAACRRRQPNRHVSSTSTATSRCDERDDTRISVSLTTIEFEPDGDGTHLVFTEQGAYLDGCDNPEGREEGTRGLSDALGADLERASTKA